MGPFYTNSPCIADKHISPGNHIINGTVLTSNLVGVEICVWYFEEPIEKVV